jgi:chromosomal replication initiation ATPase DnaA
MTFIDAKTALARRGLLGLAQRVADARHVPLERMLHGDRHKTAASARREFWNTLRDTLGLSYPELGRLTGHDHTTVMHGVKVRQAELAREYA